MRNLFDQYGQPENKLTHALYSVLVRDSRLIKPFLNWLGIKNIPPLKEIRVAQQHVPGEREAIEDDEESGLPDLCIYSEQGWMVLFEMKVQSRLTTKQLVRHHRTASRYGFNDVTVVAITVDANGIKLRDDTIHRRWSELYSWFSKRTHTSLWASELVAYMEVFETKAVAKNYDIRGTITMFTGLGFNDQNPYSYPNAKRIIRLLGDELQKRDDLRRTLAMDPKGQRRTAITNDGGNVWDFLPLRIGRGKNFTSFPHLTIALRDSHAVAALTVPNGVRGGFRTKLREIQCDGFLALAHEVESSMRPIISQAKYARPFMYLTQRHYRSQRSTPIADAHMSVDLRTSNRKSPKQKYQPQWAEAIYEILVNKRSNMQFGIEVQFDYRSEAIRSPEAVNLFAKSWIAMKPFLDFILRD